MNELIQCELCDIFVDFDEYLNHVRNCSENNSALTSSISSFLTYSISSYNSNDSIIEQDNEESDDETISYNIPIQIPIGIQIFNNNQYNINNIISAVINLQNLNLRNIYDTDENNNPIYNYSSKELIKFTKNYAKEQDYNPSIIYDIIYAKINNDKVFT